MSEAEATSAPGREGDGRRRDNERRRHGHDGSKEREPRRRSRSRSRERSHRHHSRGDGDDKRSSHHRHHHHRRRRERSPSAEQAERRPAVTAATTGTTGPVAVPSASALGRPPAQLLDETCFSSHSAQYRAWLRSKFGLALFDLPKDEAKARFRDFVAAWNAGVVDAVLYASDDRAVQAAADAAGPRTAYSWGFAAALKPDDRLRLDSVRDDVAGETLVRGRAIPVHVVARR